jgi:hypothetical protein
MNSESEYQSRELLDKTLKNMHKASCSGIEEDEGAEDIHALKKLTLRPAPMFMSQ